MGRFFLSLADMNWPVMTAYGVSPGDNCAYRVGVTRVAGGEDQCANANLRPNPLSLLPIFPLLFLYP